jgi:Zn-dependent protease with chaperone function
MILPYAWRLVCVCLTSFFLVHLALALLARCLAPAVLRFAERLPARSAARLLFALRLFPAAAALAAVAGLGAPSYLSLEPEGGAEFVSLTCLFASVFGAAIWTISWTRSLRAAIRSHRYLRQCRRGGSVWIADGAAPFLGIAGILRARLIVSRSVVEALDSDQLAAAFRHERAHQNSADNLKRLLLLLMPDALPFLRGPVAVERAWLRFTEWAADDWAVNQDAACSLSLAEALVRVARLGAAGNASPLVSPFVAASADISARVERLLSPSAVRGVRRRSAQIALSGGLIALPALALLATQPATLRSVHGLLERLMH